MRVIWIALTLVVTGYFVGKQGITGLFTVLAIIVLSYLVLKLFSILEYSILPEATIKLEQTVLSFKYYTNKKDGFFFYTSHKNCARLDQSWAIRSYILNTSVPPTKPFQDLTTGPYQGTLTIKGRTFDLGFAKSFTRCSCNNPIPCWSGQIYESEITSFVEKDYWVLFVYLLEIDRGEKKKEINKKPKHNSSLEFYPMPI